MAAMTHVVMPIAYEFAPDLVLVSAGTHAHARTHTRMHTHTCVFTHARTLDRAADRSCGRRVRCGRGRPARRPQRVAMVLRRHDAHAHDACEWQGRGRARGRVLHSAMPWPQCSKGTLSAHTGTHYRRYPRPWRLASRRCSAIRLRFPRRPRSHTSRMHARCRPCARSSAGTAASRNRRRRRHHSVGARTVALPPVRVRPGQRLARPPCTHSRPLPPLPGARSLALSLSAGRDVWSGPTASTPRHHSVACGAVRACAGARSRERIERARLGSRSARGTREHPTSTLEYPPSASRMGGG